MGNTPSTIPGNTQLNHIKLGTECAAYYFDLSATAPIYGEANQNVTLSNITGSLNFANDGITFDWAVAWNVTFDLVNDNAEPSVVHIMQSGYNPVQNGTWAFNQAPIALTLGSAGQNNIRIANVTAALDFYSYGDFEFHDNSTCVGPDSKNVFTSIGIFPKGASQAPGGFQPSPDPPPSYNISSLPALATGFKYTAAQLYTICDYQGYDGPLFFQRLQHSAIVPNNIPAGQQFNISSFETFITIPGGVIHDISTYYAQDDYAFVEIELGVDPDGSQPSSPAALGMGSANGSPSILDVSNNFVGVGTDEKKPLGVIRLVPHGDATDLVLPIPLQGSFDVTGFTAGASGDVFSINGTNFFGTLSAYGVGGNLIRRGGINCVAGFDTAPTYIFSIPVV